MAKCYPEFWGGIFDNFREIIEKLQNSDWWLLFISTRGGNLSLVCWVSPIHLELELGWIVNLLI